jgi:hypothetical protein
MSSGEEPRERPPEDAAEDQSTNEIGFRDVDEEADHDETPGPQSASEPASDEADG